MLATLSFGCRAAAPSPTHPIIGTWIVVSSGSCSEVYRFKPDGTTLVTSAEEVARSNFNISPGPDAKGFYKLVDTIVQDNGKPDCDGQITSVGDSVTRFVHFQPSGNTFVMCETESTDACFGPFERATAKAI
jgi:hypothetical protein